MPDLEFQKRIYDTARKIPPGKVITYGQLALLAGKPRAARYAGMCMRRCETPGIPCHRVVFHDGSICEGGDFGGMPGLQQGLLAAEGVLLGKNGKVDLQVYRWDGR